MIWFLKPLKFPKQFNQKPYLPFLECTSCLTLTPYQPGFHMVGVSSVNELMAELGKQTERNNRNCKILNANDKNKKPEYFVYVFVGSLMTDYRLTDDLLKNERQPTLHLRTDQHSLANEKKEKFVL